MCEYNMTKEMAQSLIKAAKNSEKTMDRQAYLLKVVNEEFGILHPVTRVNVSL